MYCFCFNRLDRLKINRKVFEETTSFLKLKIHCNKDQTAGLLNSQHSFIFEQFIFKWNMYAVLLVENRKCYSSKQF